MTKAHFMKATGLSLFLACTLLLSGCGEQRANFKEEGTGTSNPDDIKKPENEAKRIEGMIGVAGRPNVGKAKIAATQLGNMGARAESALPVLKDLAENSPFEPVKEAAAKSVQQIEAALAEGTTEE